MISVGATGPAALEPAIFSTDKEAVGFSYLLHSVLRLESYQWNWVVAGAISQPSQPRINPINLGFQTLRLQRCWIT